MEEPNNLQVVHANDENMTNVIIECVRSGLPLLIEGIADTLDPALTPLLSRNLYPNNT